MAYSDSKSMFKLIQQHYYVLNRPLKIKIYIPGKPNLIISCVKVVYMNTYINHKTLTFGWASLFFLTFFILGSITYISLSLLTLLLLTLFYKEIKKIENRRFFIPSLLLCLTIITHLPLFVPSFLVVEEDGFLAHYSDGSSGYTDNKDNQYASQLIALTKGQHFFITGYSRSTGLFDGPGVIIETSLGEVGVYSKNSYISLTVPDGMVGTFFIIQTFLTLIFFPFYL